MVRGYSKGQVRSADGTTIGYRQCGHGPALILMHGGMLAAQHLMKLAAALADDFTVYVPDRRGRGLSGPYGDHFGMPREVEDLQALVAATGAARVFGLSTGGLVSMRTALTTPALEQVVLYEPPLSVDGSVPLNWMPRYERELADGRLAAALATVLQGLGADPLFGRIPRSVLVPFMAVGSRLQREPAGDEVPVEALIPTMGFDIQLIREMADTADDYGALDARVLLLNGGKSPAYFRVSLDALSAVLPDARRVVLPGLGHSGPEDDGDPQRVADAVRDFFGAP